jgi:hypothetical protein
VKALLLFLVSFAPKIISNNYNVLGGGCMPLYSPRNHHNNLTTKKRELFRKLFRVFCGPNGCRFKVVTAARTTWRNKTSLWP